MPLTQVFLGLGSNFEREAHLCAGLEALTELLGPLQCSPVFESLPVGIKSGRFFNLVVSAYTDLPLAELDRLLFFELKVDASGTITERNGWPERWTDLRLALERHNTPLDLTPFINLGNNISALIDAVHSHSRALRQPVARN